MAHVPMRGDDVEEWLRKQRDMFEVDSGCYDNFDEVLNEYRLRADLGLGLKDDLPDGSK